MPDSPDAALRQKQYWVRARRLTMQLLAIWLAGTFGCIFFARELSACAFFGWPLSFYLAAQGVVLLYVAIVGVYAFNMHLLDKTLRNDDGNDQ